MPRNLAADHPAIKKNRTIYLKSVKSPTKVSRMLQPASTNTKMGGATGNVIRKGAWKGYPLYLLSLEERKTCPKTCQQYTNCYGNNMPFANRLDHEATSFFRTLTSELESLAVKHASGFAVRLHVLGDFYSVPYVQFWLRALELYPMMRIYGYTHRLKSTPIGRWIQKLNDAGAWVRWSDATGPMSANVRTDKSSPYEGIQCPEEVGKTASCLTCALCWSTPLAIAFLPH